MCGSLSHLCLGTQIVDCAFASSRSPSARHDKVRCFVDCLLRPQLWKGHIWIWTWTECCYKDRTYIVITMNESWGHFWIYISISLYATIVSKTTIIGAKRRKHGEHRATDLGTGKSGGAGVDRTTKVNCGENMVAIPLGSFRYFLGSSMVVRMPVVFRCGKSLQVDDSQIYAFDQAEQDAIFEKRPWKEDPFDCSYSFVQAKVGPRSKIVHVWPDNWVMKMRHVTCLYWLILMLFKLFNVDQTWPNMNWVKWTPRA